VSSPLATDLVNERVIAADKAVEESGLLKACVPGDVVPSLVIRPRVDLLPVKPGQVYMFTAEGGAGPVTATFNGQMIGEIVQQGASFTLTIAGDAQGSSAIQFSDGETTRTITLVVDRGIEHLRPPPAQPDTTELTPPECAPVRIVVDRTTLLTQSEREAGITEAQIRAVQRGVGLTGDQVDGRAGTTTRGAICRFERDDPALEVTGTITQPLLARFPVQEGGPDDGADADTGDATADPCAGFASAGTAEGARQTGIEGEITPRRLCEIQTAMGIQPTGMFDRQTRQEIRNIRESRLQEDPSQDLTELTRRVIDVLFP
jgi:hypothetical protein